MPRVDGALVPRGFGDLDAGWLERVIGEKASSPLRVTPIASTSFSHVVELADGARGWIVKWSKSDRPHPELERGHEFTFYDRVAPSLPQEVLAPALAWAYEARRAAVLIVFSALPEHTSQVPSHLPPAVHTCEQMIDVLASIHAARWGDPPLDVAGASLPDEEEIELRVSTIAERVMRLLATHDSALGPDLTEILRRVIEQMPQVLSRLQDPSAMSVVHDDIHIGNFLLPRSEGVAKLVDWQTWTADLAARDLAHMIAYFWFPSARRGLEGPLLRRYQERLAVAGVNYAWDDLWNDYRLSVIRKVAHAVWEWDIGAHEWKWYSHLQRVSLAYQDLHCAEI